MKKRTNGFDASVYAAFQERLRLYLTICRIHNSYSKNAVKKNRAINLSEMENGRRAITFHALLKLQWLLADPAEEVWYRAYKGEGKWSRAELKRTIQALQKPKKGRRKKQHHYTMDSLAPGDISRIIL